MPLHPAPEMRRTPLRTPALAAVALLVLAAALVLAPAADGAMRSTQISRNLCQTVGGGRFVEIPGFPGERIDRRLLRDIRWMRRRFDIFVTDGYSTAPYHARNGEHPIGLALDIVPDASAGGNWRKITRLARRFEPRQNRVRMPMRWVGYNRDAGHGRGHHLHLSYAHSPTRPGRPARTVYTRKCPKRPHNAGGSTGEADQGTTDGSKAGGGSGGTSSTGGIRPRRLTGRLAAPVPETGGVRAR